MKRVLGAMALVAVVAAARLALGADAKPNMKPGQWQTTITVEAPGMPVAIPPMTSERCVTEKDLVPPSQTPPGQECKDTDLKVAGNTVSWGLECKKADGTVTMKGTGRITWAGDTFAGAMNVDASGIAMKYVMTGKRLGACKAAK
jgi:hypothetical protein